MLHYEDGNFYPPKRLDGTEPVAYGGRTPVKKISKCFAVAVLRQCVLESAAGAQASQKIRIGYPSISSRQGQLWFGKDDGIFRKYGLDVELIFLRGGQVDIQALTGGGSPLVTII